MVWTKEMRQKMSLLHSGKGNPFYGKHHTEEFKKKQSVRFTINNPMHNEKTRQKMIESVNKTWTFERKAQWSKNRMGKNNPFYGKTFSESELKRKSENRKGEKHPMFGKHQSLEAKIKISNGTKLDKNPNWHDGISFEPYGLEFNNHLREQIRQRDHYRCQECFRHKSELRNKNNKPYKLNVHHIDFNKRNNEPNNLISLCRNCHSQTYYKRDQWIQYYQNRIGGGENAKCSRQISQINGWTKQD